MNQLTIEEKILLADVIWIRMQSGVDTYPSDINEAVLSIKTNNILFIYDQYGQRSGYVLWANVNIFSLKRYRSRYIKPRFFHEWTEGEFRVITQIVFTRKSVDLNIRNILSIRSKLSNFSYLSRRKKFFSRGFPSAILE